MRRGAGARTKFVQRARGSGRCIVIKKLRILHSGATPVPDAFTGIDQHKTPGLEKSSDCASLTYKEINASLLTSELVNS